MQRERVADDIYVFTSDLYAQVTASVVVTSEGAVLFDTLVFPEETLAMRRFVEGRLRTQVRYVINSHFHADHTIGTCFFPDAHVVAHARCRELLDTRGRESIQRMQASSAEMRDVTLVLPDMVFAEGGLTLHIGGKTFECWHTPGHSPDSLVCALREERVLLAADTVMSLPHFVDGSYEALVASLESLRGGGYENIIQGHGEIVLRGEVDEKLQSDLDYLRALRGEVEAALASPDVERALAAITLERCGKSRVLLNGAVEQLHRQNVTALVAARRETIEQL